MLRVVVVMALAAGAGGGAAISLPQSDVVLVRLSVDLWPDYDRRGVLVIYRGDLAPGVQLPATVRLSLPVAAGAPTAVAERQADGQLVNLTFDRTVTGESATIEAQVTRPTLQLEYYDPALVVDGASRRFSYRWPGDFEVGELTVTVQQPDLASELTTEPPAATRAPGADGLVYHTVSLGARDVGEEAGVVFSYVKEDDRLTVETMQQAMTPPPAVATSREAPRDETTVIVFALAGVVVVAAAALVILRRRGGGVSAGPVAVSGFCTQCGAQAAASDRYCHRCGRGLRTIAGR